MSATNPSILSTTTRGPQPSSIPTAQIASVSKYILNTLHEPDDDLDFTTKNSEKEGLPPIAVTETQGKFLYLLAKIKGATNVLEIGTLGGYSAIWFAKAVEPLGGTVTSLEISRHHAEVARKNITNAGFSSVIDVIIGPASDTLEKILESRTKSSEAYDFIFIDANKEALPEYFEYVLKLSKKGTVIVLDNVVRQGRILTKEEGGDGSGESEGVRETFDLIAKYQEDGRCEGTVLQTVNEKSWDGMAVILVSKVKV